MIKSLIFLIGILLSVAFLTLVERKILSYMQLRKGPNLVGVLGLMQPIGDGVKLVTKQTINNYFSNLMIFLVPLFFFFLSLMVWISILASEGVLMSNNFLFFLFLSSFGALLIFLSGWSGGSTFSFLGGIRASAQMISYEVVLSFFFLIPMIYLHNLSFHLLNEPVLILSNWMSIIPILSVMLITILAETNRAPFDLTEGESELVSGFNTEFSSTLFVLLFLGEYSFLILFSVLFSLMVMNNFMLWFIFLVIFLWVRACFPRKRYDFLMFLMWVILFPFACWMLMFYIHFMYL